MKTKLLRKDVSNYGKYVTAEKNLEQALKDNSFGIYRIIKPTDKEYKQENIQRNVFNKGEIVRIPVVYFQDSFLKFPRMSDVFNSAIDDTPFNHLNYDIDTDKKLIIETNSLFPGRCDQHVQHNEYYFHGSFENFISALKNTGYKKK